MSAGIIHCSIERSELTICGVVALAPAADLPTVATIPSQYTHDHADAASKTGTMVEHIAVAVSGHWEMIRPADADWTNVERAIASLR